MDELPNPITRSEQYLAKIAGAEPTLPTPITREERYLAKIAGEDVDIPPAPITRTEQYLAQIVENGSGAEVESLSVSANGEYTAPSGKAYSPVTVNVPNSYAAGDEGKVVSNGALVAQTSDSVTENGTVDTTLINSLEVNVPQGGGGDKAPEKDVNFIDYDGTILYSYTADEFAALDAFPANPTHEGLTAQGWNWELADAKEQVTQNGALTIGQNYVTADGATEFDIVLSSSARLSLAIEFAVNGSAVIDWGDGSGLETVTGTSTSTYKLTPHTYSHTGKYTIKISPQGNAAVALYSQKGCITAPDRGYARTAYQNSVVAIRVGSQVTVSPKAFDGMGAVETITLPQTLTDCQLYLFYSLKALVMPKSQQTIPYRGYYSLNALKRIAFSKITSIGQEGFYGQRSFSRPLVIPYGVTTIGKNATTYDDAIPAVIIPATVTSISDSAFSGTIGAKGEFVFHPTTPPTATATWLSNNSTDCKFYVPYASLAAYLTASYYPSPATYTYIGFATYNSGVTLPTQDSTEAYNVVWYASKDDAIAQTNPITQGNGKEVYCRYTAV